MPCPRNDVGERAVDIPRNDVGGRAVDIPPSRWERARLVVSLGISGPICECAVLALRLHYVHVVTLGMSGPICELTVSASCLHCMFLLSLSAWVDPSVSALYRPRVCIICSCCHSQHEWTHLWVGCIILGFAIYVLVVTLGMSEPICEWAVFASCVLYVLVVTLGMSGPICELAVSASCLHCVLVVTLGMSGPICEWAVSASSVLYVLVVTLGMSGPICELAVSASCLHCMFLLSLSAWVDPSVSALYRPRVCIICSCCHSRHEWTHLWVGCICLVFALYVPVVTLGMSGPICELAVSASSVHFMFMLSLSAWVDPSVSWLYLPHVCIVCSCCHSRHEWTHLWVGCICLECAFYVHVVTLGMSGPICELAVSASCLHCMFLLSLSAWVDPSVSWLYLPLVCIVCSCCHSRHEWTHLWVRCIGLAFASYALVVTLGMSEPICELAVSASCLHCMFLLSLLAWVDPSVSWLYLPRVCILCSCCHSRHEWTHLWVDCICLMFALYVLVVTLSMSVPICEWAVSASCLHCMFLLSLSAWVNPSVSALYRARIWVICSCCHSRQEWTNPWVGCICLEFALYVPVVTLGMSGPICECAVSASHLHYML